MGYQDREYFRNATYPYLDLIRSTRVCWAIVIVYTVVFLGVALTQTSPYSLGGYLRLDPAAAVQDWQWYRVLTASFVVDNPWHLIFSLLLIWVLGHELEKMYGSGEFLAFFLLCTVLGGLAEVLTYRFAVPTEYPPQTGPSTAALAVAFLGVLHDPYRMVAYLFLPMRLWIFGVLVGVFEFVYFLQGVPWPARCALHLGTLGFTALYYQLNWRLVHAWGTGLAARTSARRQLAPVLTSRPKAPVLLEEGPETTPLTIYRPVDEQLEAKMDAILEKVSKSGMDSLTAEEKNILKRASEELRRKRH